MRVLSLALPMLTQHRRRGRQPSFPVGAVLLGLMVASSCDKVPLLAPTGTVITLFPARNNRTDQRRRRDHRDGDRERRRHGVDQDRHGTGTGTGTEHRRRPRPRPPPAPARRCRTARWSPLRRRSGGLSRPRRGRPTARCKVQLHRRRPERLGDDHRVLGRCLREDREPPRRHRRGRARHLTATPQTLGASGGTSVISARVEHVASA